jgi:hypothetical protein
MSVEFLSKSASETITYSIDLSDSLGSSETISSVTSSISPSGLTVDSTSEDDSTIQMQLSGGTADVQYDIFVNATTNLGNVYQHHFVLTVKSLDWLQELVLMVRATINDFDGTNFSDLRIKQMLLVAARYVIQDVPTFSDTYTIDVTGLSISPTPTDDLFVVLMTLKAACIADQALYRTKASMEGVSSRCGPASLTISGNLKGFKDLLAIGPCATYAELSNAAAFSDINNIRAIMSPFVSNKFYPSYIGNKELFK